MIKKILFLSLIFTNAVSAQIFLPFSKLPIRQETVTQIESHCFYGN